MNKCLLHAGSPANRHTLNDNWSLRLNIYFAEDEFLDFSGLLSS
jgi:hypothetical protein